MEMLMIQLTDIHIENEKDYEVLISRVESIGGVINKHITDHQNTLVLLCITGDISYSGKEDQFVYASLFFDEIISYIRKRYNSIEIQLVSIPGNHDCDFDSSDNIVRETLLRSPELDKLNPDIIKTCTKIQKEYFNFSEDWKKNNVGLSSKDSSIFTENILNIKNVSIKFHCLNTAWCSAKDEGKHNIELAIPELNDKTENDIIITLMHHDESWLDWNSVEIWKKYYKNYADIILVGHDHVAEFVHKENYNAASNYYIKGNQLYSSINPEQSGFNILKVDLSNNIQRFFSYSWNGRLYENTIDTNSQQFIRNRYVKSGVELKKEVLTYIEDLDFALVSKSKEYLTLSDVYAFPVLKGESLTSKKNRSTYKDKESIVNFIRQKKFVSIAGEKEYGKTALIKQLFLAFYEMNQFPIFFDIEKIKSVDGEELNKKIAEFYSSQYNNLEEEVIMQMNPEKKVCIIDNFENVLLKDRMIKKLLQYLVDKFGIVIITSNFQNDMLNFFKSIETKEYMEENFIKLTIQDLRSFGRRKLVENWILLSEPEKDIYSQEFDVLRKNKLEQVQSVMKNGYFNKTPIEFLLVLSYLDNYEKMNTDYSRYSYIYDCLILDKINELAKKDTNEATMFKTILEQLAYKMYEDKKSTFIEESLIIGVIYDYNQDYTGVKGEIIHTVTKLEKFKILEKRDKKYKFKHNYMYYYFTGSYIKNQMAPEDRDAKITEIFSDLSKEINFNIALFLAYSLNTEYDILPKIVQISEGFLGEYKHFKYEEQRCLINKLDCDINKKVEEIFSVPKNINIPIIQENNALINDTLEEIDEEIDQEKEEELDQMMEEVMKTLRTIEFLGNIMKNYSSAIKKKPRMEIISLMNNSTMKIMGSLCSSLDLMIDKIIKIIDEKFREDDEKDVQFKSIFKQEIKAFLSELWIKFIEVNISNLSFSLQCDRIRDDIADFRSEIKSEFFDMVNVEFLIRISNGRLPVREIESCIKGKNKLTTFSQNALKENVAMYLRNYQYNIQDKQAVCSILGFKIKDMFTEEQKSIAIKEA